MNVDFNVFASVLVCSVRHLHHGSFNSVRLPETDSESTGILPMKHHGWDLSLMDLHRVGFVKVVAQLVDRWIG